jgi:hypothetical protein
VEKLKQRLGKFGLKEVIKDVNSIKQAKEKD